MTGLDDDIKKRLEENREQEIQLLQQQLEEVEQQLENRRQIYREKVTELKSSIDSQSQRLKKAKRGSSPEEWRVRDRLDRLYRELREEKSQYWQDIQDLEREKRELEKELDELRGSDFFGSL